MHLFAYVGWLFSHNWSTRGYANLRIASSWTGHLADWSIRGLDNLRRCGLVNSWTGQFADWTTLQFHRLPPAVVIVVLIAW